MPFSNINTDTDKWMVLRTSLLAAILFTILFSLLIPNSLCIIALAFVWAAEGGIRNKCRKLLRDPLFLFYGLYFLVYAAGFFQAPDYITGWKEVETKLGFLFMPMIFCSAGWITERLRNTVMICLGLSLTLASLYCLTLAGLRFAETGDTNYFFYHQLLKPINQHAVYFSVFVLISIMFLTRQAPALPWFSRHRPLLFTWVAFFLLMLYLLASKLVLALTVLYFGFFLAAGLGKKGSRRNVLAMVLISILLLLSLFLTRNPVSRRFDDLLTFNRESLTRKQYTPADYFNGLEFRLVLWPVTADIVNDNHALLTGVGSANTQRLLAEKYRAMGLYAGEKSRHDSGYLQYNCHNEFLQAFLQSGLPGLLVVIAWMVILLKRSLATGNWISVGISLTLLVFFFTESVFERQTGMILCTVLPLLWLYPRPPATGNSHS